MPPTKDEESSDKGREKAPTERRGKTLTGKSEERRGWLTSERWFFA
jgi:hypothetical protein